MPTLAKIQSVSIMIYLILYL